MPGITVVYPSGRCGRGLGAPVGFESKVSRSSIRGVICQAPNGSVRIGRRSGLKKGYCTVGDGAVWTLGTRVVSGGKVGPPVIDGTDCIGGTAQGEKGWGCWGVTCA